MYNYLKIVNGKNIMLEFMRPKQFSLFCGGYPKWLLSQSLRSPSLCIFQ